MKKIFYYFIILLALMATTIVVFFDDFAKNAVESYAQRSLNTPVKVTELRSDWSAKKINIDFIEVKNPSNFNNENAFVLNHLSATLANETQDKLIVLDQLEFDGLLFTLEQDQGKVNLVELLKKLDQQSIQTKDKVGVQKLTGKQPYRLKIKTLSLINTQLFVDTQWFKETVKVPDIIIVNFGNDQGILLAQVGPELMKLALRRIQIEVEKKGLRLSEQEIKESARRQIRGKLDELGADLDNKARKWLNKLGL
ncbi:MAG TPA: hypothetical protein EYO47_03990 [Candidatus Thioglobus sp.]|nr:hypothetical protein [Candidatus Thioglobus sp.]